MFGFDILIDEKFKAWLLEVNAHPSMSAHVCKTEKGCTHKDCPISKVDEYVKKTVLYDSLTIMAKQRKKGIENIKDRFNNMTRIFPPKHPAAVDLYDNIKALRLFFLLLTKGKLELSSAEFEQAMLKSKFITAKCQLKRIDLTMLF